MPKDPLIAKCDKELAETMKLLADINEIEVEMNQVLGGRKQ